MITLKLYRILPILLFLIVAAALALGLQHDPKNIPSVLVGNPLPAINLPALDPNAPRFESVKLIGEKILIVNVFGSWCPSCRYEHPFLMTLSNDKRFTLVGLDWKDERANANKYLNDFGNPFAHIGFDDASRTIIDLGVTGAPETFLVDTKGIVQRRITGPLTPEIWNSEIEPLLPVKQP